MSSPVPYTGISPRWANGEEGGTPLSAERLSTTDDAVVAAHQRITALAEAAPITAASIGLGNVDNTSDLNKPVSIPQQAAINATAGSDPSRLSRAENLADLTDVPTARVNLGLGNVDNTSDAAKPISAATATALGDKAALSHTHVVGDLAVTGSASSTTFLRGDGAWAVPAGGGSGGIASVTAGDSTITIGGTASAPTVAVNAIAESKVTNLVADLDAKVPATQRGPLGGVQVLSYAATITPNATLGNHVAVTATGNLTVAAPTGGVDGQRLLVEMYASGGTRTLTTSLADVSGASFPLSVAASKTAWLGLVYSARAARWVVLAAGVES